MTQTLPDANAVFGGIWALMMCFALKMQFNGSGEGILYGIFGYVCVLWIHTKSPLLKMCLQVPWTDHQCKGYPIYIHKDTFPLSTGDVDGPAVYIKIT